MRDDPVFALFVTHDAVRADLQRALEGDWPDSLGQSFADPEAADWLSEQPAHPAEPAWLDRLIARSDDNNAAIPGARASRRLAMPCSAGAWVDADFGLRPGLT